MPEIKTETLKAEVYDHKTNDLKWQKYWAEHKIFQTNDDFSKPKYYTLDMFPYPSGAGLHVGHPESYTATDIIARYKTMKGFNVLRAMGWDAFGLPAEQYAIQTGTHPRITTEKNIANFKRQINSIGFSYDWTREIDTTDPNYYKWTQWIFLKLFKKGLAFQDKVQVNWCPELGTVLSNEEVIDGKSERGGFPVERQPLRQWMLRITQYADRLESDLENLNWPEAIKLQQRNWIGKSTGAEVIFTELIHKEQIKVFTTRPDTLFGVTYMVLAPEHPLVTKITTGDHHAEVDSYIEETKKKSDIQRTHLEKEKTGVFTGAYAVNPVNGKKIPIYISDYVLSTYGTGAIMAVPAHDERDFAFAKKYKIEIIPVLKTVDGKDWDYEKNGALSAEGIAINSGEFNGLTTNQFKEKISAWLEQKKIGKKTIQYKLRDWVFSRQRYWGEPIPIYFPVKIDSGLDPKKDKHEIMFDQPIAVDEKDLPLKLPELDDFKPGNDPAGPLAKALDWRYFQKDGKWFARETNTMPQWAGSSWYFLRYIDAKNDHALADSTKLKYWLPVDVYIGGAEHAVLHLLYARFWHKFLFDEGIVTTNEPFTKLRNQGLILAEDGNKMSKSRGNVVNPDEVIAEHGADCLRMYEMFMGPLEQAKPWSTKGMMGVHRFIDKIWRLSLKPHNNNPLPEASEKILHKTIKKVGEDIESESFNTAISTMMELVNDWTALEQINKPAFENFLKILTPFAPHVAEEVWEKLGHKPSIYKESWPAFDEAKLQDNQALVVFQVNGKVRAKEMLEINLTNAQLEAKAKEHDNVRAHIDGKEIVKIITVPKKLVNIVVK